MSRKQAFAFWCLDKRQYSWRIFDSRWLWCPSRVKLDRKRERKKRKEALMRKSQSATLLCSVMRYSTSLFFIYSLSSCDLFASYEASHGPWNFAEKRGLLFARYFPSWTTRTICVAALCASHHTLFVYIFASLPEERTPLCVLLFNNFVFNCFSLTIYLPKFYFSN